MSSLENAVLAVIEKEFSSQKIFRILFENKLKGYGVNLDKEQIKKLESVDLDHLETFELKLTNLQESQLSNKSEIRGENLSIEFNDADFGEIEKLIKGSTDIVIAETLEYISRKLIQAWKSQSRWLLLKENFTCSRFNQKVAQVWRKPFNSLEMFIGVCFDNCVEFCANHQTENDVVFDTVRRLQIRASQIGYEILALMRAGFADGAMARWRTLHETAVISLFIAKHGEEVAERYLEHTTIANYKEMVEYKKYHEILGEKSLSEDEFNGMKNEKEKLCEKYGKNFYSDYGWASSVLSDSPKFEPSFVDIEKDVGQEYLRSYYKFSNINIHAGSKSIFFQLGMPNNRNLSLAGPSIFGHADPGQNTAISIFLAAISLLQLKSEFDIAALLLALQEIRDQVFEEFIEAHNKLEYLS
jgi:hypothetical protein